MKDFDWNPGKNEQLMEERGVSFEEVVFFLMNDGLLDDIQHPNAAKYPNQRMFIVRIDEHAHLVPYVESEETIFLKTIIRSRKATKRYLGAGDDQDETG